jgi:hypothetical protein
VLERHGAAAGRRKTNEPEVFNLEYGRLDKPTVPVKNASPRGRQKIANKTEKVKTPLTSRPSETDGIKEATDILQNNDHLDGSHHNLAASSSEVPKCENDLLSGNKKNSTFDCEPPKPKKARHLCKECGKDTSVSIVASYDTASASWRSSKDKVKQTIQYVVDQVCGLSASCNTCVKRQRSKSVRQAREAYLKSQLEAYSTVKKVLPVIDSQLFCICGGNNTDGVTVECSKCKRMQHAGCLNYNLEDPWRGDYICPLCWTKEVPVPSKATLIITPSSISYQWIEEFGKHLKEIKLKMHVYKGISHQVE